MEEIFERVWNVRHLTIFVILWSFILGVLVSSFIKVSPLISLIVLLIAGGILLVEKIVYGNVEKIIGIICIALVFFSLGAFRYALKDFHEDVRPLNTGIVASEPEKRDADTRFVFESDNGTKVLVTTDMFSPIEYGDRVEVDGVLKVPGVIDTPSTNSGQAGKSFDYGKYLSKDDIYYTESFAKVMRIAESQLPALGQASGESRPTGFRLIKILLKIKNSFVNKIKSILPEPEASLLAGLTVSGKQALPKSVQDDFTRAGVVQVVVLSGYNVTIIAEFFLRIFGFLSLRFAAGASAIGIVLFTLMTGATATVVRASIMALVVIFGKRIGRNASSGRLLLFTAFLMLIQNPKILAFDPSFELSFLAMLALVYVVPILEEKMKFLPEKFGFRTLVATTIAAQVTVFPFLLYNIGAVSIVSLFSNLLIMFAVPPTMLIGFLATFIAFISKLLAWPFAFLAHLLLAWILGVAHVLGNLSWASVSFQLPLWACLLLYAGLITLLFRFRKV